MTRITELIIDAREAHSVAGTIIPPGDKSITHRALFLGALNRGNTVISSYSPAADCRSTLQLLLSLGYGIREDWDHWELQGNNDRSHPEELRLDCGNSGTTVRLAAGFLTGESGRFTLTGDESLSRRPMNRVLKPLSMLGADVDDTHDYLPVTLRSDGKLKGSTSTAIDVGSAQVHAALVLAGLRSREGAMLHRSRPMRDHTLRMLRHFGIDVNVEGSGMNGQPVERISPACIERDISIQIPGDISSAAFLVAATLLVPGSRLTIREVGLNRTRTSFLHSLKAMGAKLAWSIYREEFEPVGTMHTEYSPELSGIDLSDDSVDESHLEYSEESISIPEMMDELPLLMLIASQATGTTTIRGAAELRLKESDRISATVRMLMTLGIEIVELEDGFTVVGPQRVRGGVTVDHYGDHRLCMMAAVAALIADGPVNIQRPEAASVSYPGFWDDLESVTGTIFQRRD